MARLLERTGGPRMSVFRKPDGLEGVTGSLSIGPVWNACIWPCFGYAFDPVGIPRNVLQSIPAFALRTIYALHPSVSLGIRPALYRQICIWNAFGTSELSPTDLT